MVDLGTTQGIPSWLNLSGLKAPSSSPALTSRSGLFSAASPPASTKGGKCESGAMKNQKEWPEGVRVWAILGCPRKLV